MPQRPRAKRQRDLRQADIVQALLDEGLLMPEAAALGGGPRKSSGLHTLNQSWAATLKVLIDNRDAITEALVGSDLASVEIVPG